MKDQHLELNCQPPKNILMKLLLAFSIPTLLLLQGGNVYSQEPRFNLVITAEDFAAGTVADIKQDPQGFIWLSTQLKGIQRYDGSHFVSYMNDPRDPNSISNNRVPCIHIDSSGVIWAATYGGGLNRFDPEKNGFTHYRHNAEDESSLANDTVFALLRDHTGTLWVGTYGGLDVLNEKTGKFIHYKNIPGDTSSLSYNRVWFLYEDRQGTVWVGCGSPFFNLGETPEEGGLNRFDRTNRKFIRYLHDPNDPGTISSNKVRAIYEDRQGNFWVGSTGDGLQVMDRKTGKFTHYYYDPAQPDKLSRPPVNEFPMGLDHITFINQDQEGFIWIGTIFNGINRYDPVTKKVTHFGIDIRGSKIASADTSAGFHDASSWRFFSSRDNLLWFSTMNGNLYNVNLQKKSSIPYEPINQPEANSFFYETNKNILWIGTFKGLVKKDLNTQTEKVWTRDPLTGNGLSNDSISSIRADGRGNLWIATNDGLCKLDLTKELFTTYRHNDKDASSISGNIVSSIFIDHAKNLWLSAGNWMLDKLDPATDAFTHYKYTENYNIQNSVQWTSSITEDRNNDLWITPYSLIKLDHKDGKFHHYLPNALFVTVVVDADNVVWAGASSGLYRYDRDDDQFIPFVDPHTGSQIAGILHILEDDHQNLWISTNDAIIKISPKRDELRSYGKPYGVHRNLFSVADNYKAENGKLFLGDQNGYYSFFPDSLKDNTTGPIVNFTSFKLGAQEVQPGSVLKAPIWQAKEINLNYSQNTFSIDFLALDYRTPGENQYLFMLENYDNSWHYTGTDHKAYLFNVPPGHYVFRVRAINSEGNSSEKAIRIIISPPWWRTWWAYTMYAVLFLLGVVVVNRFMRNRVIEKEKAKTRERELAQAKEIEKAYHELKLTQAQLIQSEKMASLGELTAGIAHEIQNPLNFVNNFSDVNTELIDEAEEEMEKGNISEAKSILSDVRDNEQKINHHGKRADSIVKGMLQHSRTSTGIKEPTDINKLADEYLRLAYHGLRAKDKSFNAKIETDLDNSVAKIDIVPQEIGRVLLNLINNAFYAVNEKTKLLANSYEPLVKLTTRKLKDKIEIRVVDNGNGIPKNIADKIFQPFFTTKPTGQGTGLGLSLAYDIVKAHGGEIKVETKEGEGSELTVYLPIL